jgi:beta-glucosidase
MSRNCKPIFPMYKLNRIKLTLSAILLIVFSSIAQNPLEQLIQEKIDAMSLSEKIKQLHGQDMWSTEDNIDLNIPGFAVSDGPHGVRFVDATALPTGIAIAASWNRELAHDVGRVMGKEFHAYGKHQQLGPALDLCRDPRNGRSPETGGEDPFLCAHINIDLIKGIQENPTIATVKHFNGVNKQANRHQVNHNMSYRQMMEHYGYNFRRVIQDAGALSLMNAYNRIDGDKCAENSDLLTHVLRDRWGFPFYVISDWGSVFDAKKALKAGCDLEMVVSGQPSQYQNNLINLFNSGEITDADLDKSIRRVLRVKYLTGMMDNFPEGNPFIGANTPGHKQVALEAGREAIVLLKNEANILPITDPTKTVALVGPSAKVAQLDGFGSSWVDPPYAITPYQGFQNKIPDAQIQYAMGCQINNSDTSGFEAARAIASSSDYVIFVGGLDQTQEGENYHPGPVDRTGGSVELPGMQQELIKELAKVNPNVIVVIKSGGICAVPNAIADIKGFLYAFYPGMEGGNAIADVIYGAYNPSGKLPVTMPLNDAQMPVWNDDFSDDYNGGYRYYDELGISPQFAFGHGLSYTTFTYNNIQIASSTVTAGTPITVSVDVQNTGTLAGEEVVQLYLENNAASLWMPRKELKGFEKIALQAGETKTVTFTLTANELYYFNPENDGYEIAIGDYIAHAGGSSDALTESAPFTITEGTAAPDLEISRIFSYPRYPSMGDSVLFLALLKNQGTQDMMPGTSVKLMFEVNGSEISSNTTIDDTLFVGGAILIGANQGVSETPLWIPTENISYTVTATIDSNAEITEHIESNNALTTSILVADTSEQISTNLCYQKPVSASSIESFEHPAENAVDGNFSTRWSSQFSNPQYIFVDLLDLYHIDVIALAWESAYSSEYTLEVSEDKENWIEIIHDTNAKGGNDLFYPEINARFIRVEGLQRATQWGHSLFEIQAFGELTSSLVNTEFISKNIRLYPSPTSGDFFITGLPANEHVDVDIYNILGKLILKTATVENQRIVLPVQTDSNSMYLLHIKGENFKETRSLIME